MVQLRRGARLGSSPRDACDSHTHTHTARFAQHMRAHLGQRRACTHFLHVSAQLLRVICHDLPICAWRTVKERPRLSLTSILNSAVRDAETILDLRDELAALRYRVVELENCYPEIDRQRVRQATVVTIEHYLHRFKQARTTVVAARSLTKRGGHRGARGRRGAGRGGRGLILPANPPTQEHIQEHGEPSVDDMMMCVACSAYSDC